MTIGTARQRWDMPTRRLVKGRKTRAAAKVVTSVRAQCVERDGYCRMSRWYSIDGEDNYARGVDTFCSGPSEWAHVGEHTRAKTRGMAPERRHTTAGSLMLCRRHHHDLDAHRITVDALTAAGADGPLRFALVEL